MDRREHRGVIPLPSLLSVEAVAVKGLILDPRNPRRHSTRQIRQIARSIESFGFNVPVLIDGEGKVIAGHGRLLACKQLGIESVPVVRLAHLSTEQAKAFAIADNRLTEIAIWDERLLGEIFSELAELDLDFTLEATGFTMGEIDLKIEGLTDGATADAADDLTEAAIGQAVSRPGDLWRLGRHRLLCASAIEPASYAQLMGDARAAIVFTDPPYNVRISGHVTGKGKIRHREFAVASGEMTAAQFVVFLTRTLQLVADHSAPGSLHYVCMDWRHFGGLLAAAEPIYGPLKNLCVWVKDNGGMGALYRSAHELVAVFKLGDAPHRNNVELGRFGRNRTNVWRYAAPNRFGGAGEDGALTALHPTVKPVGLVADALLDASARGDGVLDPFLGSGTTLLAAERVGRTCYGLEIDPLYVDLAIRRWRLITGDDAVHDASGETFTLKSSAVTDG